MKRLTIRGKITFWFASALIVIVALTLLVVLSVSRRVVRLDIQDSLIAAVEDNVDEVEYFPSQPVAESDHDMDHYITYEDGYLEIDDDFLDAVNGVYTSLYTLDGTLLYGENPLGAYQTHVSVSDSTITEVSFTGGEYYVFDRILTKNQLPELYLRGVVSARQRDGQLSSVARLSLVALPILMVIALCGGYFIAGRSMRPVAEIQQAAREISQGKDLKKRIGLGEGNDELHQLANTFDEMFARLDSAFASERQFTSDASHELRTPAAVISAQCQYILEKPRTQEEYVEALEVISRQSGRMNRLIGDMLELSRMERNGLQMENVDFSGLVLDVSGDLALLEEQGIKLNSAVEPDIIVSGDRERLSRMLSNLISNAYRYGKKDGHIHVALEKSKDHAVLSVSDDGIGIAPDQLENIFRRFYQAEEARSGQGNGLGLAMVQEIAELHGGGVSVESQLKRGSKFIVKIPLKK